jgi:hypothetical protein
MLHVLASYYTMSFFPGPPFWWFGGRINAGQSDLGRINNIGDITTWMVVVRVPVERASGWFDHAAATTRTTAWFQFPLILCHGCSPSETSMVPIYMTLQTPQISQKAMPISPKVLLRVFHRSYAMAMEPQFQQRARPPALLSSAR